jgi:hypothetical protein
MNEKSKRNVIEITDAACKEASVTICHRLGDIVQAFLNKAVDDCSVPHAKVLINILEAAAKAETASNSEAAKKVAVRPEKPQRLEAEFSLAQLILDSLAAFDRGEWTTS